jgi:hypothetical protein
MPDSTTKRPRAPHIALHRVAAVLGLGLTGAVALQACDSATQFDDLCGWLGDEDNCYRKLAADVGTRCGGSTPPSGVFVARDKLGECFLDAGGIITFEPPIDLASPPTYLEEPLTFKVTSPDATECGSLQFFGENDFSVTIAGDPEEAGPDRVLGGSFSMAGGRDSDSLAVNCPDDGAFTFNRLQLSNCSAYEGVMPRAELDFNPGGVDVDGVIAFRVYYPPAEGTLEDAEAVPVEYFSCIIPAAPQPCANGLKDGSETDVDCGGSFCSQRCGEAQFCVKDGDCDANLSCVVVSGLKQCTPGA